MRAPPSARDAAVAALAALVNRVHQPQAALPTLLKLVKHDPLIRTRMTAAAALAALGDASAIPTLQTAEDDPQLLVRINAANAIASIENASR